MKKINFTGSFHVGWGTGFLAICLLMCSWNAAATAPRIAPKMFGEETQVDILRYRLPPSEVAVKAEGELLAEIVTAAFNAADKAPALDIQPSKQLAKYALYNNQVVALIGSPQDFSAKEKKSYRIVTFYLRGAQPDGAPVALIFGKHSARGDELYQAFNKGMRAILASGKYLALLERYHGKVSAEYIGRLMRDNPTWK